MHYTVKKSLFGKKLVDYKNNVFKLKNSSYKIKFDKDNSFKFYQNGKAITPALKEFSTDDESRALKAKTTNGEYIFIDPELCNVSPVFIYKSNDIIVDKNDDILILNTFNYKTTSLGYKIAESQNPDVMLLSNELFAKNNNGKFGTVSLSTKTLGQVACPFVFDSPNITYNKDRTFGSNTITTYNTDTDFIMLNTNKDIIMQDKIENLPKSINRNFFSCYNNETDKSTVYAYDMKSDSLQEFGTYNGNVIDAINNNSSCVITKDKNNNYVVLDKNNQVVFQGQYDNVKFETIRENHRTPVDVVILEKDGKYGVFVPETKQVIQPNYYEIDLVCSGKTKEGEYKFFAKDLLRWGVVNANNQTELPFVYTHYQTNRQYATNPNGLNVLEIRDFKGNVYYFDICEKGLFVNDELKQVLEAEKEKFEKIHRESAIKAARELAGTDRSSSKKQSTFTEDDRMIAMAGATLLAKNPAAGLIVNELMKE